MSEPDHAARIVLGLTHDLSDILARALVSKERTAMPAWAPRAVAATTEAIERVLRASRGSISISESNTVATWFMRHHG